ncbi:hypothetical protein OG413_45425 [Streptomyces sp. NBC_01433]|uniref:hypothetical protein n=1 Tax=Streptomyces sp. NBC_01433 TaxID=2903864 RepID=UPI002250A1D2|nr:hypothetical protein [Streptomyces sp. NBC_01433]MCX4681351.1 hypothetical protein [Streptomyces sp. NBC_01433]MCX4681711.1 hypothetical protein [Streptomyces sp. NBC_01433]MCX4682427.1 hypothetical protein [Streptomyces sp. NBC_01433]
MFEDCTAAELANALDSVRHGSPENTGILSLLDQATLRWAMRHPELVPRQQAFAQARQAQWPRTRSETTWQTVVASASKLATALREHGDAELRLCQERTGWGTCHLPLPKDGPCRSAAEHLPAPAH